MNTPDKQLGKATEQKQDKPKRSAWIRPTTALTFATALAVSTVANIGIRSYLSEPEAPKAGQLDKEEELKRLKDEIEYKKGILEIQDMEIELLRMEEELKRKMLETLQEPENGDRSSTLNDA